MPPALFTLCWAGGGGSRRPPCPMPTCLLVLRPARLGRAEPGWAAGPRLPRVRVTPETPPEAALRLALAQRPRQPGARFPPAAEPGRTPPLLACLFPSSSPNDDPARGSPTAAQGRSLLPSIPFALAPHVPRRLRSSPHPAPVQATRHGTCARPGLAVTQERGRSAARLAVKRPRLPPLALI